MTERYYLDTSIWIDIYENRKGYNDEPLGDFAWKLLLRIMGQENKIVITDIVIRELEGYYTLEEINGMMKPFEKFIEKVFTTSAQRDEARRISRGRNLPNWDVLHTIIARDNNLILITRDKHFLRLDDLTICYKPEEII